MRIVILGLTSDDVGESYRHLAVALGDALDAALAMESIAPHLKMLFFTPIIIRPEFGPFPDKISYLRREPSVNASTNISYEQWTAGGRTERVNLLAEALVRIIDRIRETKLSAEAKAQLRRIVEDVRQCVVRQGMH